MGSRYKISKSNSLDVNENKVTNVEHTLEVAVFYNGADVKDLVPQDYKDVRFSDNKQDASTYFNHMMGFVTADVYGFLGKDDNYTSSKVISTIVNKFLEYPQVQFCYSDNIFGGIRQFFPSCHTNILSTRMLINTPLFIRKESLIPFNTDLKYLYNYHMLQQLTKKYLGIHIPLSLYECKNSPTDLQPEINIINQQTK